MLRHACRRHPERATIPSGCGRWNSAIGSPGTQKRPRAWRGPFPGRIAGCYSRKRRCMEALGRRRQEANGRARSRKKHDSDIYRVLALRGLLGHDRAARQSAKNLGRRDRARGPDTPGRQRGVQGLWPCMDAVLFCRREASGQWRRSNSSTIRIPHLRAHALILISWPSRARQVWEFSTGARVCVITPPTAAKPSFLDVRSALLLPCGTKLASGGWDRAPGIRVRPRAPPSAALPAPAPALIRRASAG